MEDAKGRVGLGDLRCGGVSDMEAKPRWPFTGSSLLGTSEGRFSLCWEDLKMLEKTLRNESHVNPPRGLAPLGKQILRD